MITTHKINELGYSEL